RALREAAAQEGEQQAYLIAIGERAEAVLQALEDRKLSTQDALQRLEALMQERLAAEAERGRLGFDARAYAIYLHLKDEGLKEPQELTRKLAACFTRFPNHAANPEEFRQLKAELYKPLLIEVGKHRMVELADVILRFYMP
ncbi:MAG: type I restriction endonuclease subunit R, partial [Gammaproteobacteria bacterium]